MGQREVIWQEEDNRNCCFRFRHVILIFSCMAMSLGIILVAAGALLQASLAQVTGLHMYSLIQQQADYQAGQLCSITLILMMVSGCVFILGLFPACVAVAKDSLVFISVFSASNVTAVLVLLCGLVLSVQALTEVNSEKVNKLFNQTLLNEYKTDVRGESLVTVAWDQMQLKVNCCGVEGDNPWKIYTSSKWYQQQPAPGPLFQWVPLSCCGIAGNGSSACLVNITDPSSSGLHEQGCKTVVTNKIKSTSEAEVGLSAAFGAFTLYGQCLICIHCGMIIIARKRRLQKLESESASAS